jgi:micrococcal nuclease
MMRRHRRCTWAAILAALAILAWVDHQGWLLAADRDDMARYHRHRAEVVDVIDGDTIEVALADPVEHSATTRVRLWGIDCPEVATPAHAAEPWAREATAETEALARGSIVTLRLEPQRTRGTFGRVLAHVDLPDGSILNERLLTDGLARADERWPHAALDAYARAERAARSEHRGIWSLPKPAR